MSEKIPENEEPVYVRILARYKRYKPQARKQGYPIGRWQTWNGYGWQNTDLEIVNYEEQIQSKDKE